MQGKNESKSFPFQEKHTLSNQSVFDKKDQFIFF